MKLEVNIGKKSTILIFGAIILLIGVLGVIAFGGNQPQIMGHSIGELQGPSGCNANKYIWYNSQSGLWGCSDVPQGGGQTGPTCANPIVVNGHTGNGRSVHPMNMPANCIGSTCTVTMSVSYLSSSVSTLYHQFSANNGWTASPGLSGTNGNNIGNEIISIGGTYLCDDKGNANPKCHDENNLSSGENNANQWTVSILGSGGNYNGYSATIEVCW